MEEKTLRQLTKQNTKINTQQQHVQFSKTEQRKFSPTNIKQTP